MVISATDEEEAERKQRTARGKRMSWRLASIVKGEEKDLEMPQVARVLASSLERSTMTLSAAARSGTPIYCI